MGEFGVAANNPVSDGLIELVQMTGEEMVCVVDEDQFVFTGQDGSEFGNFASRAVLIIGALNK